MKTQVDLNFLFAIMIIVAKYFQELFKSSNSYDLNSMFDGFSVRVTSQMNNMLTALLNSEEIKQVVFGIKGTRIRWVHGSILSTFLGCLPTVIDEIQGFFQSSVLPLDWNHTQLCLIPKVTNANRMHEMRPINL